MEEVAKQAPPRTLTDYQRGLAKAIEICRRVQKESNDLTADSEDYRIGNWAAADKCAFGISCEMNLRPDGDCNCHADTCHQITTGPGPRPGCRHFSMSPLAGTNRAPHTSP